MNGRTVTIKLRNEGSRRARPADAASATILTATGVCQPMAMDAFGFALNTTQTTVDVPFGTSETGDTVWITAFWSNARSDSGPSATPVQVNLPLGGALASVERPKMRIAKAA